MNFFSLTFKRFTFTRCETNARLYSFEKFNCSIPGIIINVTGIYYMEHVRKFPLDLKSITGRGISADSRRAYSFSDSFLQRQ